MTTINSRVFLENPVRYFNLAKTEEVAVKRGKYVYRLILRNEEEQEDCENISPSGDPYWADPRNVAELDRRLKLRREGKTKLTRMTPELRKELLGL